MRHQLIKNIFAFIKNFNFQSAWLYRKKPKNITSQISWDRISATEIEEKIPGMQRKVSTLDPIDPIYLQKFLETKRYPYGLITDVVQWGNVKTNSLVMAG